MFIAVYIEYIGRRKEERKLRSESLLSSISVGARAVAAMRVDSALVLL